MARGTVRFMVLGPLAIERGGQLVGLPRSALLRGLLGVLLLAGAERLDAGRLSRLVWAGRADRAGRGAVQVGVSRLREWLRGLDGEVSIEHSDGGYRLAVPPLTVDLGRFRAGLAFAERAGGPAERCALLASALGHVRGPVLADLALADAGDPLVSTVQEAIRTAALDLGRAALDAGTPHVAVGPLEALVDPAPLDEPVHALLIELLAAAGRPADALGRYERLRARLASELGVGPSRATRQAHLTVLAQDRELAAAVPAERPAAGDGRLRVAPARLPAADTGFSGRGDDLARLDGLLPADLAAWPATVVIAAITGPAGVGKTALALHWARRVAHRFPDGQLYVDLGGNADPPLQPLQAITRLLGGLAPQGVKVPAEVGTAAGLYRSLLAGRRLLIVLDNAHDAEQVRPLLPGQPGCVVLVTSRDPLAGLVATHGARRLRLDGPPASGGSGITRQPGSFPAALPHLGVAVR